MADTAAKRSGGCAVPNGFDSVVYKTGTMSCRYLVVWIPSSLMKIAIHSSRKVESRGYGKEADVVVMAGVDELMWWKEDMRFDRRILVRLVIYISLSSSI